MVKLCGFLLLVISAGLNTSFSDEGMIPGRITNGTEISIDRMIQKIKDNNYELKMLSNNVQASQKEIRIAQSWENPTVGTEYNFLMNDWMGEASQKFPFFGKQELKKKIAENEAEIQNENLINKKIEMLSMAKGLYWRLWWTDKAIDVYHENIDLMKRFYNIAKSQYITGKKGQLDVVKADLEISTMEKMLLELHQERNELQAKVNELMGEDPANVLSGLMQPSVEMTNISREELVTRFVVNHPLERQANVAYLKSGNEKDLETLEWFPDFMVGAKYGTVSGPQVSLNIELPLFFDRQSAKVEKMADDQNAMKNNLEQQKLSLLAGFEKVYSQYNTATNTLVLFKRDIIPASKQEIELNEASYVTGKSDFLDLLESQRKYLNNNLDYYKTISEAGMALADLEYMTGTELQENH